MSGKLSARVGTSRVGTSRVGVAPEALEAARWLGWRALRRGRHATAERLLRGCAALDPHDAWTWRALATLAF
ncbi:MAG: tetratricopeptide repeat protein, partial [Myxococcota bacterium]